MNIPSIIARHLKSSLALPQSMTTLVKEMSSLNRLSDPDRIFPGQNLNLPVANQDEAMRKLSQIKPANEYAPVENQAENAVLPHTETIKAPRRIKGTCEGFRFPFRPKSVHSQSGSYFSCIPSRSAITFFPRTWWL